MKHAKQILCTLLSALLILGVMPPVYANTESPAAPQAASVQASPKVVKLAKLPADKITWQKEQNGHGIGTYDIVYNWKDGAGTTASYDDSIYLHSWNESINGGYSTCAAVEFDVSEYTATDITLITKVGLRATNGTQQSAGEGSAQFSIWADGRPLNYSSLIRPANGLTGITQVIPAGTKKLQLAVDDGDDGNSNDWSCWYDPYITTDIAVAATKLTKDNESSNPDILGGEVEALFNTNQTQTFPASVSLGLNSPNKYGTPRSVTYDVSAYTKDSDLTLTAKIGLRNMLGQTVGGNNILVDQAYMEQAKAIMVINAVDAGGAETTTLASGTWGQTIKNSLKDVSTTVPKGTAKIRFKVYHGYNVTSGAPGIDAARPSFFTPVLEGKPFATASLAAPSKTVAKNGTVQLNANVMLGTEQVDASGYTVTYESSNADILTVNESGLVTANNTEGTATVTATIEYKAATFVRSIALEVTEPEISRYLSDMQYKTASIGYGNLGIDKDSEGNKIHFRNNGNPVTFEKGLFTHADSTIEYDIEGLYVKAFRATVGINDSKGMGGDGNVIFRVYADGTEIYATQPLNRNSTAIELNVAIPENAKVLKIRADANGSKDNDHAAWGDARIAISAENAKVIESFNAVADNSVLNVNGTAQISVSGKLLDGSVIDAENATITYASSDDSILTVDESGKVTAKADGTAYVTVTATTKNEKTVKLLFAVGTKEEAGLYRVASPDGTREAVVCLADDGKLYYAEVADGKTEIGFSMIGLDTSAGDFSSGLQLVSASAQKTIDETYTLTARTKSEYRNYANERSFVFSKDGSADGATMTVTFRAYCDGIAFRYTVKSVDGAKFDVNSEKTEISVNPNSTVWAMNYTSTHEGLFAEYEIGKMTGNYNMPMIIKNPKTGLYTTITEAVFNSEYPLSRLEAAGGMLYAKEKYDPSIAKHNVSSPFESPWRLFVTGTLAEISESSMVTDVSPEPDSAIDYSFVEPGVSTWSWLTHMVDQANPGVHKKFIDFAAEMGYKYYTMDDGWQIYNGTESEKEYKEIIPDGTEYYDWTDEVIAYAKSKGVKVLAWVHKRNLEGDKLDAILESYAQKGIAGIKVDFFNSENAQTMALLERIYKKCAQLGMVVNCHGANKPTGEVRTYPNVLAREAVRGNEYGYIGGMTAQQYTVIPFTRGITGPVDVTETIYQYGDHKTTAGSQIALSVIVASGIHYISCMPEQMKASEVYDLYKNFPAVWDESKLVDAELGKRVIMARRSGDAWYVGGITTDAESNNVSLGFLSDGNYLAQVYMEGEDKATSFATESRIVTKNDAITVNSAANGGFVIKLTKLGTATVPAKFTFNADTAEMKTGDVIVEKAVPSDKNAAIIRPQYVSSNNAVATVSDNGKITAVGAGTAEIKALSYKDGSVYDTINVTVKDKIEYPSVSDGTVIYVSATGNDANNGTGADQSVKTFSKALELLAAADSSKEKVIRVSGTVNISGVTLNQSIIIEGCDSDSTITTRSLTLHASLELRNICFNVDDFLNTEGYAFTVGDNVRTAKHINMHSGKKNADGSREHVTINSGSFNIQSGTYYNDGTVHDLAGADYILGGNADVRITFKADAYLPAHKGTTISDTVNIINNGAKVRVDVTSYDILPLTINGGVQIINNNAAVTSVYDVPHYVKAGGYYVIYADKGCTVEPTAENGTFNILAADGYLPVVNGNVYSSGVITVEDRDHAKIDVIKVPAKVSMEGIQIRTSGVQGLRFIANIEGNYSDESITEYGIIALPKNMLGSAGLTLDTQNIARISNTQPNFKIYAEKNGVRQYTICITGIKPEDYSRDISVRAYLKYTVDGEERILYSDIMTGNIIDTAEELTKQYPDNPEYVELYRKLLEEQETTFVSASEFKSKLTELALADTQSKELDVNFNTAGSSLSAVSGEPEARTGWSVSGFYSVENYEIVQYCLCKKNDVASLAFYDADKNFIKAVSINTDPTKEYELTIYQQQIPEKAAFVRFSNCDSFGGASAMLCNDIGKALNDYCVSKDKTDLTGKKIVCVGDSLTYGDYGTTEKGQAYSHPENYPYYLQKYTGATVEWYACCGYTAKALAQDYKNGAFSGNGRPGVSVSVKDADYVIVMLGTNGGLPLIGDRSNYDAYLSLVRQLKEDTKYNAKIVLMTPPHATEDESKVNFGYMPNVQSAYSGVKKIAEACGVTVFDVYRDSGFCAETEKFLQPNDGLHFGGVGYSALAAFVANELRLLKGEKLGALTLSEAEDKADSEFLAKTEYPKYEIANGTYSTMGRWFKKSIDGVEHDVTLTSGSELYFLTSEAESFTIEFTSMTEADELYYAVSIDGGAPVRYPASQKVIALPDKSRHIVRVTMDGINENIGKWNQETGYAVKDITVKGGRIRAIRPTNKVIFYFGDSITEGVMSQGNNGIGANNSAVSTYAYKSAEALGSIPYFIGYGASGICQNGSFANMLSAIDNLSAARKESDSVKPSEIVINHGYNDNEVESETFKSELRKALTRLNAKYPGTPIYYAIPFSQRKADEIREVCGEFENVTVIETNGIAMTYQEDGIHPDADGHSNAAKVIAEYIKTARLATNKYADYIKYRKPLQNTNHKLLTDKSLNVAYFGGSVTQGYGASNENNIWRKQTQKWLSEKYPEAQINEIYACIGESGTYLGTYLLDEFVLAKEPDLVFLEYAINDRYAHIDKTNSKLQCETIVREIKQQYPKCDIVMLITIDESTSGENWFFNQAQAHSEIAEAYNIPIIYMGHALSDYINNNPDTCKWSDYFIDIVHPTDAGYLFYTDVIEEYLSNELLAKVMPDEYLPDDVLPELQSEHLMDGNRQLVYATDEVLAGNDRNVWKYYPTTNINGKLSNKGSIGADVSEKPVFKYTFNGTELAIFNNIVAYSTDAAGYTFKYTVDGGEEKWGHFSTHNPTTVVSGLAPGEHTITIQIESWFNDWGISRWYIDVILTRDASLQTVKK